MKIKTLGWVKDNVWKVEYNGKETFMQVLNPEDLEFCIEAEEIISEYSVNGTNWILIRAKKKER